MDLQHINLKLFFEPVSNLDLWEVVPVFHRWIQEGIWGELLVDVADYRHVPGGPGIVLIGHQADYSVDNTDQHLGFRYNRKAPVQGSNRERLGQAFYAALRACQQLETEPAFNGQLRFVGNEIKLSINDRLLVPNVPASYEAIEPEIKAFLTDLLDGAAVTLQRESHPRNLFGFAIKTSQRYTTSALLDQLEVKVS
ncbi:MAG: hypothetical protein U0V70_17175 [Terriglobia bacterium]